MDTQDRPDPDQLLRDLKRTSPQENRGRLKIFLGMCPGVGKTYAMLEEARERQREEGTVVLAALVETHGRVDTGALLDGLLLLPRKQMDYKGTRLEEMDLEDVLLMRPGLVLVDELAHTNAPESRHPKRYQDVLELLENGIDVYSTLNVQHLESCAQDVRGITGVEIRETVPDSILERADEIRLVDVPPSVLLQRLREGKVYLGDRAAAAADNFFREPNLVALRELALRVTARRVDQDLRSSRHTGERLLVAIRPDQDARRLIRRGRNMAYSLGAPWAVSYAEGLRPLSAEGARRLDQVLSLAREMGAEVMAARGEEWSEAMAEAARKFGASQMLLTGPAAGFMDSLRWLMGPWRRLSRLAGLELHLMPAEEGEAPREWLDWSVSLRTPGRQYSWSALGILAITLAGVWLEPVMGYWAVAIIYLFGVLLAGMFLSRGPAFLAGLLSALLWDLFFIPPRFSFSVSHWQDAMMLVLYLAIALVTGQLTSRMHSEQILRRRREERAQALLGLISALQQSKDLDSALASGVAAARQHLGVELGYVLAASPQALRPQAHASSSYPILENAVGAATWAHRNLAPSGNGTSTLPGVPSIYIPLRAGSASFGVLGARPVGGGALTMERRDLLEAFAGQVGMLLERENLRRSGEDAALERRSNQLQKDLLASLSHELRTPLTAIRSAAHELAGSSALGDEILKATDRLDRLVGNLLNSARLESGQLELRKEWGTVRDLVEGGVSLLSAEQKSRPLVANVPEGLPLLNLDFPLAEQALANLLDNAFRYSPPGSTVAVQVRRLAAGVEISVQDQGPGIPDELMPRLFGRFQRASHSQTGGSGLGLSIARGFVEAQGGKLRAENFPQGGAGFMIAFPIETQPSSQDLK